MVRTKIVRTYIERLYCDECSAEMEQDNDTDLIFLLSMDKTYHYNCPKCGAKAEKADCYPKLIYREGELV